MAIRTLPTVIGSQTAYAVNLNNVPSIPECDAQLAAFWPTLNPGDIVRPPTVAQVQAAYPGSDGATVIYRTSRTVMPIGFGWVMEPNPGQSLIFSHEYPATTDASPGPAFQGHRVTGCDITDGNAGAPYESLFINTTDTNEVTAADLDRCITGHALSGNTGGLPYGTVVDSIVNPNRFMIRSFASNDRSSNVANELGNVVWKTATLTATPAAGSETLTFAPGTFVNKEWADSRHGGNPAPSGGPWRVDIETGPAAGTSHLIEDNATNTLTVDTAFSPQPQAGNVVTIHDASAHWTRIPASNVGNLSGLPATPTRLTVNWQVTPWATDVYKGDILIIVDGEPNNGSFASPGHRNIIANGPDWIEVSRPFPAALNSANKFEIFRNVATETGTNETLLILPTWRQDSEGASAENFQFGPGAERITFRRVLSIGFIPPGAEGEYRGQTEEHNTAYRFIDGYKDIELDACDSWSVGGDYVNIHGGHGGSGGVWVHDGYKSPSIRRRCNRMWMSITGGGADDILIERNGAPGAGGWSGRSLIDIEPDSPNADIRRFTFRGNYSDRHGLNWIANAAGGTALDNEDWLIEDNIDNSPGGEAGIPGHVLCFLISVGANAGENYTTRNWSRIIIRGNRFGPQAGLANPSAIKAWEDVIIENNDQRRTVGFKCLGRWRIEGSTLPVEDGSAVLTGATLTTLSSSGDFGSTWSAGRWIRIGSQERAISQRNSSSQITVSPAFTGVPNAGNTVRLYLCGPPSSSVNPTFTVAPPVIAQMTCVDWSPPFANFTVASPVIDRITIVGTPPVAPGNFQAVPAGSGELFVSWSSVSNATGYHLDLQIDPTTWLQVYDGPNLSRIVTGRTNGVTDTYRLWAYNLDGVSPTVTTTGTPVAPVGSPPTNPSLLVADPGPPGSGEIDLNWQPATDPEGGTVGYTVHRSADGGVTFPQTPTAWVTGTTWTDTGRPIGVAVFYRVRAFDPEGNQSPGYSNVDSATPPDITDPPDPGPYEPGLFTLGSAESFAGVALTVVGGQGTEVIVEPPDPGTLKPKLFVTGSATSRVGDARTAVGGQGTIAIVVLPDVDVDVADTIGIHIDDVVVPLIASLPTLPWDRTDAEILEPAEWLGQRADRWEYELVTKNGSHKATIHPVEGSGPVITVDSNRPIVRTLDGVIIAPGEIPPIIPLSDRLIVRMILENGSVYPMGRFLFGDFQQPIATYGDFFVPNFFDESFIIDQPLDRSVSIDPDDATVDPATDMPANQLSTLFIKLANEVGITDVNLDVMGTTVGEPVVWPAGTSRLKVLTDLADLMGCLRPYLTATGTLRCKTAPKLETPTVDHSYGPGRMFEEGISKTDDSYRAPNRYIRIGSSMSEPVVGVFDVPAIAPHSIGLRGFVVADVADVQGIEDEMAALDAARAAYVQDVRTFESAAFSAPIDPRHDVFDVIRWYNNQIYMEVGWRAELWPGGNHEHDLVRLWEVTE